MKYDYVLFDLDGTLTDSAEGITKCVQYALSTKGITVEDRESLYRFIGPPLVDSFRDFYGFSDEEGWELTRIYRSRYETIGLFENRVYDGILEMMKQLKDHGVKMALATSKPQGCSQDICEHFGLLAYLDVVCGAAKDGSKSSKPELMRRALSLMGADPARAVMVGDRKFDVDGANAIGIDCIGVTYGFAPEGELAEHGATYIVDTPAEIEQIVLGDDK